MAADKNKMSRRDLFVGGFRRLRKNAQSVGDLRSDDSPLRKAQQPKVSMFEMGEKALQRGELDKAVRRLRECVKTDTGDADARLKLGEALYRLGKHVQARVELERVLRLRPKENLARLYLGLSLCRLGKADRVRSAWEDYFEPDNIELQREINLQLAILETDEEPDLDQAAAAVERAAGVAQAEEET
ncbi:MAG: tetratricopeptide repeat protein [Desulfovibrionaceae bacterium]